MGLVLGLVPAAMEDLGASSSRPHNMLPEVQLMWKVDPAAGNIVSLPEE
jgi:hypothetical protein